MTRNAPPPTCVRCGHERFEHDSEGCAVRFEEQNRYRTITYCPCEGYEGAR